MTTQPDTIGELLLNRLDDHRPGLRCHDRTRTWDEVVRESAARAHWLHRLRDPNRPFHIGVLLDNTAEFVLWLGGAALSGATIIGINPTRRGTQLEREVRRTDPQLVVTDTTKASLLTGLDLGVPRDRVLFVDSTEYAGQLATLPTEPTIDPAVTPDTRMLLLFTSGTTGAAKAAICSQGRLVGLARQNTAKYHIDRHDVCYCCMPLFHGNALMALWAPALLAGACLALTPRFTASGFLRDVRYYGATYFTYVGQALAHILSQPEHPDDAHNTLTHGFGTEAAPTDQREFARRFGATVYEGYGSSESAGMIERSPDGPPTALGVPAHRGVRIVDPDTLATCPPAHLDQHGRVRNAEDAIGEIVDTEGAAKFEGYYNDPAANAERLRHGWYWTGDLGYVDSTGHLYFAGRAGDWIRVDGENISALRVEHVLHRHPDVIAAAVFAVPDARSGDQVMAALEIPERCSFADLDLAAFLTRQSDLDTKGTPRYVRVAHHLPVTGSNKLRKKEMRADAWHTTDTVYWWPGRREPSYSALTSADVHDLREQFTANGRTHMLP